MKEMKELYLSLLVTISFILLIIMISKTNLSKEKIINSCEKIGLYYFDSDNIIRCDIIRK